MLWLLDILAFSPIFEPLLYLIIPSFHGKLSITGKVFQVIGAVSFIISIVFFIKIFSSNNHSFLLFIIFFGISYISGVVCMDLDPEREKRKEKQKLKKQ